MCSHTLTIGRVALSYQFNGVLVDEFVGGVVEKALINPAATGVHTSGLQQLAFLKAGVVETIELFDNCGGENKTRTKVMLSGSGKFMQNWTLPKIL